MTAKTNAESDSAILAADAKILVINDSPDFLNFMREFLTLEGGYEVATLDQSEGIVEQISSAPPDLIILDVVFHQGRSGFEVAEALFASVETAGVPILFCTALADREITEAQRARVAERNQRIILKPFDVDDLLREVEELLAHAETV